MSFLLCIIFGKDKFKKKLVNTRSSRSSRSRTKTPNFVFIQFNMYIKCTIFLLFIGSSDTNAHEDVMNRAETSREAETFSASESFLDPLTEAFPNHQ